MGNCIEALRRLFCFESSNLVNVNTQTYPSGEKVLKEKSVKYNNLRVENSTHGIVMNNNR